MEKSFSDERFKYLSVVKYPSDKVTYVCLQTFNPKLLKGISDRRVSFGLRTADVSDNKLHAKGNYVSGGAGIESNILQINRIWDSKPQGKSIDEELANYRSAFLEGFYDKAESLVLKPHGITLEQYKKGEVPESLRKQLIEGMEMFRMRREGLIFGTYGIFGGVDEKGSEVYHVSPPDVANKRPYYAMDGSGIDRAEIELSQYIQSLPQHKRTNIDPIEGTEVLLRSLVRAESNEGVGGTPDIVEVTKSGTRFLEPERTELMRNIVVKELAGDKTREEAIRLLTDVSENGADLEDIASRIYSPKDVLRYRLAR